ncbi:MAG: hypothetical protein IT465_00635 [Moraxellaceae bacterium]|nr:hypothetical protein [Moraxellaceae bacterium]
MMNKLAKILTALGLLISVSACASAEQGGDKQKRMPPPEALSACKSFKSGDACQFTGRRNDTVKGICFAPTEGQLACKPTNPPQKPQS